MTLHLEYLIMAGIILGGASYGGAKIRDSINSGMENVAESINIIQDNPMHRWEHRKPATRNHRTHEECVECENESEN